MRTLAAIFKALSDETRLSILGLLFCEGELCVCDFVDILGVTQSKASRHLRHLVHAGLLQDRRDALWVYFRIVEKPGRFQSAILHSLSGFLPQQLPAELRKALKARRKDKAKGSLSANHLRPRPVSG